MTTTPTFTDHTDWHDLSLPPLPAWLSIARLTAAGDALNYHSALLLTFATSPFASNTPRAPRASLSITPALDPPPPPAEALLYTPHGIPHTSLSPLTLADPPLRVLAFLHGLHDVRISAAQQLNLGARNGLLAQRALRARYWVATHDEVKTGGGLISWFLRRRVWTLEDALGEVGGEWGEVAFRELGNGEGMVLE